MACSLSCFSLMPLIFVSNSVFIFSSDFFFSTSVALNETKWSESKSVLQVGHFPES
jgi:hypothetical protein